MPVGRNGMLHRCVQDLFFRPCNQSISCSYDNSESVNFS